MKFQKNPTSIWLLIYVLINVIAGIFIFSTGELMGDLKGGTVQDKNYLIIATVLVCLSYILILWPLFNTISKIKVKPLIFSSNDNIIGEKIGNFLLVFQFLYMIFNFTFGVNVAGSNNVRTSNPIGVIFVLIPVDMLFFIYYGNYRDCKKFYPNLFLYFFSKTIRGWGGHLLLIIFLEFCRNFRRNKIRIYYLILLSFLILFLYPVFISLKWFLRYNVPIGNISIFNFIDIFYNVLQDNNYFALIGQCFLQIIERIQTVSIVTEVINNFEYLQAEFSNKVFIPFWMEGLHGIIIERLTSGDRSNSISVDFTKYLDTGNIFNIGDWNINIGYPSWFFIAPYLSCFYILYTILLGFISFFLTKKIGYSSSSKDLLWLAWLLYLLPPWFNVFVLFIYSQIIFLLLKIILNTLLKSKYFHFVI